MNSEIESLINKRQELVNKLCFELINMDKGKTRINLKNAKRNKAN